jgi:RNA polymerase sigma factor (sigma-70 family)
MRSEPDIVRGLIAGEAGAFDEMVGLCADRIWRFLMRLTRNKALAEDLFQETWLAAASHAHLLREDSSLVRWLYTIARNAYRMAWRNTCADLAKCTQLHFTSDEPRSQDDAMAARLDLERANAAMLGLPEAFREVLVLCGLEELSSEDAAAIIGISPEAIRKRLSRARALLVTMLGQNADEKEKSPCKSP